MITLVPSPALTPDSRASTLASGGFFSDDLAGFSSSRRWLLQRCLAGSTSSVTPFLPVRRLASRRFIRLLYFVFFLCFPSLFLASMPFHRFSLSFDLHRNGPSFPCYGNGSSSVLSESIKMICCGLRVSDDIDRFPSTKSLSSLM